MGYSTKSVMFFDDSITIDVESATLAKYVGRKVSISKFANGRPVSVETIEGGARNGEMIVRAGKYPDIDFIEGPVK